MINKEHINLYCTGCSACETICPAKAISMLSNSEGFLYPEIDNTKCTKCNACNDVCQINNYEKTMNPLAIKCYAAMNNNIGERMKSVDGGVIALIAKYIISNGGYFCGAAFINGRCKHIIIDKFADFEYMRGSKYMQSDLNNVYIEIKKLLEQNKTLAFTGTPCQVSGLKLFLKKHYENLLTIDFVCHGVMPHKVFNKFAKEYDVIDICKNACYLNFRAKGNDDCNAGGGGGGL